MLNTRVVPCNTVYYIAYAKLANCLIRQLPKLEGPKLIHTQNPVLPLLQKDYRRLALTEPVVDRCVFSQLALAQRDRAGAAALRPELVDVEAGLRLCGVRLRARGVLHCVLQL